MDCLLEKLGITLSVINLLALLALVIAWALASAGHCPWVAVGALFVLWLALFLVLLGVFLVGVWRD